MNRLTQSKSVSKMDMIELAYNSCYAKDCKARYRDYDTDIDARELTIQLLDKYVDVPNEFTCDEDFDDYMLDSLQYGTSNILGLIAVFYRNIWAMADLRERLEKYENLEERLEKTYRKCGDLLEEVVAYMERHTGFLPDKTSKTRLLTDDDVDRWEEYKAIGTVEECREAREKQQEKKYVRGLDKDVKCPICGLYTTDISEHRYCTYCGQRLV